MQANRKVLLDILAILGIVLIAVIGYKLSPLLLPKADVSATVEPGCDLHRRACAARLPDGGRIELSITPRPIPMVDAAAGRGEDQRHGSGQGRSRFRRRRHEHGLQPPRTGRRRLLQPGLFRAEAMLPVCVTGKMAWAATVLVEAGRSRIAVPFHFNSVPD